MPERGYQDNPNVINLLTYPEQKVDEWEHTLTNLYKELSPDTCSDEYLDYLAYLFGYTEQYWSLIWSNEVKRNILKLGMQYWQIRGTKNALDQWLSAINIRCIIWTGSVLQLPFTMPKQMGTRRNKVVFRLPLSTRRGSYEWLEAVRMQQNLTPVMTPSRVGYETFKVGFSKLGEPMFSRRVFVQDIMVSDEDFLSTDTTDIVTT